MFDEESQMKDAEAYRVKMDSIVRDCEAGNVGAISCHHAAEYYSMIDVSAKYTHCFLF